MTRALRDERGRPMSEDKVKVQFGINPKSKWPLEGMPPIMIQGIKCWVGPMRHRRDITRRPHFGLRAMCECPQCGRTVTISRLPQHDKIHQE